MVGTGSWKQMRRLACMATAAGVFGLAQAAVSATGSRSMTAQATRSLPRATARKLPRWRGFNLLNLFHLHRGLQPFEEEEFRWISELGFNFVRIPMDYRFWIRNGDWEDIDESVLRHVDRAIELGAKYGVHVCLNFHRAPGYTVAKPPEPKSLWSDPDAQRVCAMHWRMFARRYRGIPNERLSFNLVNEPAHIDAKTYAAVVRKLVGAIREEDPDRLIIADGLDWGRTPVFDLADLGIAQATRGYDPSNITHYQASWVGGSDRMPFPQWPRPLAYGTLYGTMKPEYAGALEIHGPFPTAVMLRLHVQVVSSRAHLVVEADGRRVWEHDFRCGPGKGEWKEARYIARWKIYANLYDRDYTVRIPSGVKMIAVHVTDGDWLRMSELGVRPEGGREAFVTLLPDWGRKPVPLFWRPGAPGGALTAERMQDREWLWKDRIEPWKKLEAMGVGVMVGEWGAYNKTPHDVVLRWMQDCLENWRRAGWGWALWNFRGAFGILDSGRTDVQYEPFRGHQLDRRMLELLQRY